MSLTETVFVAVKDEFKPRYYSNLTQFLKGISQGNCHSDAWKGYKPHSFTLYFSEGTLTGWTPTHERLLRQAIEDVMLWPLPGTSQASKQKLPWAGPSTSPYNPGTPETRKIFVDTARLHIEKVVGI